jgi:hypothetical protein
LAVKDKKMALNDAVMELHPVDIILDRLLPRSISDSSQAGEQNKTDYKIQMKIACHSALKAASYTFVLSVIPPL